MSVSGDNMFYAENGSVVYMSNTSNMGSEPYYSGNESIRLFLTPGYKNALAFLEEKNALPPENESTEGIVAIFADRYNINPSFPPQPLYFRSYHQTYSTEGAFEIPEDKYSEVLSLCKTHYAVDEGGYLLYVVEMEEDSTAARVTTFFLPEGSTPEYIKSKLK